MTWRGTFPFLFGKAFNEAEGMLRGDFETQADFPSFSERLSLRPVRVTDNPAASEHFPSFSEGLSLRLAYVRFEVWLSLDFPSFSEGLSLRLARR